MPVGSSAENRIPFAAIHAPGATITGSMLPLATIEAALLTVATP
jgi:hypothetical protein